MQDILQISLTTLLDLIDTDPFIWPVHTLSARPKAYRGDPACPDPAIIIRDPIIPDHLDWMLQDLFIQGFEPQQLRMILRQSVWRVEGGFF